MMNNPETTDGRRRGRIAVSVFAFVCIVLTLALALGAGDGGGGTLFASNAQAAAATSATLDAAPAATLPEKTAPAEKPNPGSTVFDADPLQSLAESLRQKERELNEREARIAQQEQALETLRLETQQTLQQIEQVRREMQSLAATADQQRQKQMKKWIEIYQKMEPAKVATVLMELDSDFQFEVLSQTETGRAAKILGAFPPARAAELGRKLGR